MKTGYSAVTAHVFTYKDTKSNTAFQILYADYPAGGIGKTDPTIRMAKAWDGIVQGVGAEPNDFRKLKVDGYPAIDGEVGIRASGEWLRIRMIVDSERLYMLSAMPIRPENTKAIDAFISSFAITK